MQNHCGLIKPFVLRRFRCARFGLYKVHAAVVYKKSRCRQQCSVCFYICDLNLEVIEKFQANETVRPVVFHTGKVCTIRPWKFPEIHTGIFGRMESALGLFLLQTSVNLDPLLSQSNRLQSEILLSGRSYPLLKYDIVIE